MRSFHLQFLDAFDLKKILLTQDDKEFLSRYLILGIVAVIAGTILIVIFINPELAIPGALAFLTQLIPYLIIQRDRLTLGKHVMISLQITLLLVFPLLVGRVEGFKLGYVVICLLSFRVFERGNALWFYIGVSLSALVIDSILSSALQLPILDGQSGINTLVIFCYVAFILFLMFNLVRRASLSEARLSLQQKTIANNVDIGTTAYLEFDATTDEFLLDASAGQLLRLEPGVTKIDFRQLIPIDSIERFISWKQDPEITDFECQLNNHQFEDAINLFFSRNQLETIVPDKMLGILHTESLRYRRQVVLQELGKFTASLEDEYSFFEKAVNGIARLTGADYALISEWEPNLNTKFCRTIHANGEILRDIRYNVEDTPCELVAVQKQPLVIRDSVQSTFPKDQDLVDWDAESYVAIPINAPDGIYLGHIAILFKDKLSNPAVLQETLEAFSYTVASEILQLKNLREIHANNNQLQTLFDHNPSSAALLDLSNKKITKINFRFTVLFDRNDSLFELREIFEHDEDADQFLRDISGINSEFKSDKAISLRSKSGKQFSASIHAIAPEDSLRQFRYLFIKDVTEELEKERMNRVLNSILENTSDYISMGVSGGNAFYCNPAARNVLGWSKNKDLSETNIYNILPKSEADRVVKEGIPAIKRHGIWRDDHVTFVNSKGELLQSSFIMIGDREPDGSLKYISIIARDFTNISTPELRSNDKAISELIDKSREIHWISTDENFELLDQSNSLEKINFTQSPEAKTPGFYDSHKEHIRNELKKNSYCRTQLVLNLNNGDNVHYIAEITPLLEHENRIEWLWILREANDLAQVRTELRKHKKKLELITQHESLLVSFHDPSNGKPYEVSQSILELLGYQEDEFLNTHPIKYVQPDDLAKLLNINLNTGREEIRTGRYRIKHKKGNWLWVETSAKPIYDGERIVSFLAISRHIEQEIEQEKSLQKSKQVMDLLLSQFPIVLYRYDRQGFFTESRGSGLKKLGLEEGQVVGQSLFELYSDEETARKHKKALAGEDVTYIYSGQDVNGDKIFFETRITLDWVDGGGIGFSINTTERELSKESLRLSEAQFRKFFENCPTGMVLRDMETNKHIMSNRKFQELIGYTEEEIRAQDRLYYTAEEDQEWLAENVEKLLAGEVPSISSQKKYRKSNGELFRANLYRTLFSLDGKIYVGGYVQDIEEELRQKEELQASEERFRKIFEDAPVGMALRPFDRNNSIEVNKTWAGMLGYSPEELKVLDRNVYTAEENQEQLDEQIQKLYDGDVKVAVSEKVHRRKDGTLFRSKVFRTTIENNGEKLLVGWIMDMEDQKQNEEQIQALLDRYRGIFENSTVAIMENDMSSLSRAIKKLHKDRINAPNYINRNPAWVQEQLIANPILDLNPAFLEILEAPSVEYVRDHLHEFLQDEAFEVMVRKFVAIAKKDKTFHAYLPIKTLSGQKKTLKYSVSFPEDLESQTVIFAYVDVTQQHENHHKVKVSERRYRRLFNTHATGLQETNIKTLQKKFAELREKGVENLKEFLKDKPGLTRELMTCSEVLAVNKALLKLTGFNKMKTYIENRNELISKVNFEVARDYLHAVYHNELPFSAEVQVDVEGENKVLLVSAQWPEKEVVDELMFSYTDLTDWKRAQEALRESDVKFRAIIENSVDVFVIMNPDDNSTFISPSFENHFGSVGEEAKANDMLQIVHPDDQHLILNEVKTHLAGPSSRKLYSGVFRLHSKDGNYHWYQIRLQWFSQTLSEQREAQYLLVMARDINSEVESQALIEKNEMRFRGLFNNGFDGVLAIRQENRELVLVNDVFKNVLGYPVQVNKSVNLEDWLDLEDEPSKLIEFQEFLKALNEQGRQRATFPMRNSFGHKLNIDLAAFIMEELEGSLAVFILKDITAQKKAEEEAIQLAGKAKQAEVMGRELTTHTLYTSQKNRLLTELKDDLSGLLKQVNGNAGPEIERIRRKLDRNLDQGESWLNFKLYFERVHPDFFKTLLDKCPKLSTNELKHCAYIKMNMAPAEVAELLFVERKTVEISRYRVKKKLGLGKDENLIEFIRGLN